MVMLILGGKLVVPAALGAADGGEGTADLIMAHILGKFRLAAAASIRDVAVSGQSVGSRSGFKNAFRI